LPAAVKAFPNLQIVGKPGRRYLRGILDVPDGSGGVACSYLVEIKPSARYPFRYPFAYEVGGDIPVGADNHKYSDNSLCLGVEAEESVQCHNGLALVEFIEKVLIPHLANQYYHYLTGSYLQEYAHGDAGVCQYYEKLLGTTDTAVWATLFHTAFDKHIERNGPCCCGSGQKFKRCHERVVQSMQLIGKEQVERDFKSLHILL
jgi:hypothetical protein